MMQLQGSQNEGQASVSCARVLQLEEQLPETRSIIGEQVLCNKGLLRKLKMCITSFRLLASTTVYCLIKVF